jgi:hypothetical protein
VAAHYEIEFPDKVNAQLKRVLKFVKSLYPADIYTVSELNQVRAALEKPAEQRAKKPFLIVKPSLKGAAVIRAGVHANPNHEERYDLPLPRKDEPTMLEAIRNGRVLGYRA